MLMRVKGIKRVRAKGRIYLYHRRTGKRLVSEPGTRAFLEELDRLNGFQPPAPNFKAGTLGGMIAAFKASPEFTELAKRTRIDYQRVFDHFKPLDRMLVRQIDSAFILGVRDRAFKKHKRRFANYTVQVFSLLLAWGKPRSWCDTNAATDVPMIRRPRNARKVNPAWTDEERATVLSAAPPHLRVPIGLGMFTGMRIGDVIRFTWGGYHAGNVEIVQSKTGEALWFPAHRDLRAILDGAKRVSPLVCIHSKGQPYTQSGFNSAFYGLLAALQDSGHLTRHLTFHGLRHSVGKLLAEAGCDTQTIAAMLGQRTRQMAEHYSAEANLGRKTRAAVRKLERKPAATWKTARTKMENQS